MSGAEENGDSVSQMKRLKSSLKRIKERPKYGLTSKIGGGCSDTINCQDSSSNTSSANSSGDNSSDEPKLLNQKHIDHK